MQDVKSADFVYEDTTLGCLKGYRSISAVEIIGAVNNFLNDDVIHHLKHILNHFYT